MINRTLSDRIFSAFNYIVATLFTLICFIPFYTMVIASVTEKRALIRFGYQFWPSQFTLEAYQWVLRGQAVLTGYAVTVFVTLTGTLLSLTLMCALAYAMSNKKFKPRNPIAFYVYFTMIFSGGIIPWFITMRAVGLYDNIWALIVPMLMNPWWIFVLRNYFNNLPTEILESARIDGASDLQILTRIVLPLSTPVLATTALFVSVAYWNDWWHGVMLLDFADFRPLQVIILRIINNIRAIREAMSVPGSTITIDMSQIPALSIRMAIVVVTIGPIILVYPFVQRYFIHGLTLGAIKG
ncbi:MAG: carbohydrate ABC transporter permease [Chloroflexi bacterium]|nr:carbohydrate ABC transporter permease [Chloroflexota bacterium]